MKLNSTSWRIQRHKQESGDPAKVAAIKEILDRGFGKAMQPIAARRAAR
jgi:hypothetical protein